jgi:hypothetical protein
MRIDDIQPHINPNRHIDGEALARAARNPKHLKRLVEILRRNGASDRDIVQAMARARTVISALRLRR